MGGSSHSNNDSSDDIVLNQENVLSYGVIGFILGLITIFTLAQAGKTTLSFQANQNAYNMIQKEKENLKNYSFKLNKNNNNNNNKLDNENKEIKNESHNNHNH